MFDSIEDKILKPVQAWHGVAIGWHDDQHADIIHVPSDNSQFVAVKLPVKTGKIFFISLYAPTAGKDDEFLECISELSSFILSNLSHGDQLLIGTDSNCSKKSTQRRQLCWTTFCDTLDLQVHSTGLPTFHHHNGSSESAIDFLLSSKDLNLLNLEQLCTQDSPLNLSSHDVLLSSIQTPRQHQHVQSKFSHTYSSFNPTKIIWDRSRIPEYQQLASQALSDAYQYWDAPETTPLLCSLLPRLLVRCAEIVFESKTNWKQCTNYSPKVVRQAEILLIRAHRKWKKAGKPESALYQVRKDYNTARSNLQYINRQVNNLKNIRMNNDLMQSSILDKQKIYSKMKYLRGNSQRTFTSKLVTPTGTYQGEDVLEGLAADAEHLGKPNTNLPCYDNYFYKLCMLDNIYIFELKESAHVKIPLMTLPDLQDILHKQMKLRKSCDIYCLTVEHLRECGSEAQTIILNILNRIIQDMYQLSCPQLKLGLASSVFKGKNKPVSCSRSYRRITVTPQIGAILDRYVEPIAESIFRKVQSPEQLGFTANMSYLMASVVRGECQRWARDHGSTCFGVSLDGEAAFPSVEREIQIRELYSAGERGDILKYSKSTYQNTECHLKLHGKLSRKIAEHKGNRQGHVRASGHYKAYVNPCLSALCDSKLGFQVGPICITSVCIADDLYALSGSQSGLQGALNIVSHYARRHRVTFNAEKTKLVVTGSPIDMKYYQDIQPWTLNNQKISVVENNDHLGLVVSGTQEEQKNVDSNIQQCRNSMFALLGPAYAYKCLLAPAVQCHLSRTYSMPVLRSGLSALPIRPHTMNKLSIFHRKVLRGFLKLSSHSPTPSLYFLLGELPLEARIHMDIFTLFFTICNNPETTANKLVCYLLKMTDNSSTTWSAHIRILAQKYNTPDPLLLIQQPRSFTKESWRTLIHTKVRAYHERELRELASKNSKMKFLNVQTTGLMGQPHIALQSIVTTRDVAKLRSHLKFLCCDLVTGEILGRQQGGDPSCRLCLAPLESTEHIIATCRPLSQIRERLLPELLNTVKDIAPECKILADPHSEHLTQFLLDCTSLNLPNGYRLSPENSDTLKVFKLSRDWCYTLMRERSSKLKALQIGES